MTLRTILCTLLGHIWRWHADERPPTHKWCERCGSVVVVGRESEDRS